ncbi:MAG: YheC/YheD family protein [Clostridia bacterium]
MKQPSIGILTWRNGTRFGEPAFFRRLIRTGEELGATVFLFSPEDVSEETQGVRGFVPNSRGEWVSRWYPWPDIVLDRYRYYPLKRHQAYLPFRKKNLFRYANSRFANKWRVHQLLWEDGRLRPWLPETHVYSEEVLWEMLERHPFLYLKPSNGTGGRSIVRIEQQANGYVVWCRGKKQNKQQRLGSQADLAVFLDKWIETERSGEEVFLLQQGLQLSLVPQRTVDVRLLIQKNEAGEWKITGLGGRMSGAKSAISNLHGGGKALRLEPLLHKKFGSARARQIVRECCAMAKLACHTIEQHYGQMVEFGMDIGVDVEGHIWLIEMNPKPGREIFREIGDLERYGLAIKRPIQYALYLLEEKEA